MSADDDPSGQGGAGPLTYGARQAFKEARHTPAPRLTSAPITHRIHFCPRCGIGQAVAHRGPKCQYCGRTL